MSRSVAHLIFRLSTNPPAMSNLTPLSSSVHAWPSLVQHSLSSIICCPLLSSLCLLCFPPCLFVLPDFCVIEAVLFSYCFVCIEKPCIDRKRLAKILRSSSKSAPCGSHSRRFVNAMSGTVREARPVAKDRNWPLCSTRSSARVRNYPASWT